MWLAGKAKPSREASDSLPSSGFPFHKVDRERPDVVAGVRRLLLFRRPLQLQENDNSAPLLRTLPSRLSSVLAPFEYACGGRLRGLFP